MATQETAAGKVQKVNRDIREILDGLNNRSASSPLQTIEKLRQVAAKKQLESGRKDLILAAFKDCYFLGAGIIGYCSGLEVGSVDLLATCRQVSEPMQKINDDDWRSAQERLWLREPIVTANHRLDPQYLSLDGETLDYTAEAHQIIEQSKTVKTTESSGCPAGSNLMAGALLSFCCVVWGQEIDKLQQGQRLTPIPAP